MTSQQHQVLLAIKALAATEAMSIGDLAAELLIKRLEKAGFTQRSPDVEDRRRVLVSLTEAGEGVLAALSVNNL